jgi:hypothetical protein
MNELILHVKFISVPIVAITFYFGDYLGFHYHYSFDISFCMNYADKEKVILLSNKHLAPHDKASVDSVFEAEEWSDDDPREGYCRLSHGFIEPGLCIRALCAPHWNSFLPSSPEALRTYRRERPLLAWEGN